MTTSIDELAAVATAATRGPWRWEQHRYGPPDLVGRAGEPGVYEYESEVLEATHYGECGCRSACTLELNISEADMAYLAAASPEVILDLVTRLKAAEAAIARVRAVQPTWHAGMYGARDDMYSAAGITRALEGAQWSTPSES